MRPSSEEAGADRMPPYSEALLSSASSSFMISSFFGAEVTSSWRCEGFLLLLLRLRRT